MQCFCQWAIFDIRAQTMWNTRPVVVRTDIMHVGWWRFVYNSLYGGHPDRPHFDPRFWVTPLPSLKCCLLCCWPNNVETTVEFPVIRDIMILMFCHCNVIYLYHIIMFVLLKTILKHHRLFHTPVHINSKFSVRCSWPWWWFSNTSVQSPVESRHERPVMLSFDWCFNCC